MNQGSFLPTDLRSWTKLSLERYGLIAGRKMGQHFLVDSKVLLDILKAAALKPTDQVLEVGGGLGVLTLGLLEQAKEVVVVELDNKLAQALGKIGMASNKLKIIVGDVIKLKPKDIQSAWQGPQAGFVVVANLPYEITGAFINKFLWGEMLPQSMTLLVQREVAQRMVAKPGKMSLLSLGCQLKSQVKIIRDVPPQAFWPPPQVHSSLVRLDLFTPQEFIKLTGGQSVDNIWRLARIGFSSRRKLLLNNLVNGLSLPKEEILKMMAAVGLMLTARAQELSVHDWVRLAQAYNGNNIK